MAAEQQPDELAEFFAGKVHAVEAFVALTDAPQRQQHVLRHQTRRLLSVLWRLLKPREEHSALSENSESVLRVALQLLHHQAVDVSMGERSSDTEQTQLALLDLVNMLRPWSLRHADNTGSVLVELLFQVQVPSAAALVIITQVASEASPTGIEEMRETLLACTSRTPEVLAVSQRWRERGLHAVNEKSLPAAMELLRDGTEFEQELVLLSLLLRRRMHEYLVLKLGGTELLAKIVRGEGNAGAKAFALVIVEGLVAKSTASREVMLRFWLDEQFANGGWRDERDAFLLALRGHIENFVGESIVRMLQDEVELKRIELIEQPSLVEYLCKYHGLIDSIVNRLTTTLYDGRSGYLKANLWSLLLDTLERVRWEDCVVYPQVVVDSRLATAMAILVLEVDNEEPFWEMAVRVLRSCIRIAEMNCEIIADRGAIPLLVQLLAVQRTETSVGRQLIGLLRAIAAVSRREFAAEINQVAMGLCSDRRFSGGTALNSLAMPVYFQNLLLLYRDIPEMKLGVATGIDQAIAVGAAAELMGARTSEIDKVIAVNYLHDELQCHKCDLVQMTPVHSVTCIVSDKVAGIIGIAMDGPEEARHVARRILTALAVSIKAVSEKLRKYQFLEPPIVMPELLDTWKCDHSELLESDDQIYEYDDSESEDEKMNTDNADAGDPDVPDDASSTNSNQPDEIDEQKKTERAEKHEDEWELV